MGDGNKIAAIAPEEEAGGIVTRAQATAVKAEPNDGFEGDILPDNNYAEAGPHDELAQLLT